MAGKYVNAEVSIDNNDDTDYSAAPVDGSAVIDGKTVNVYLGHGTLAIVLFEDDGLKSDVTVAIDMDTAIQHGFELIREILSQRETTPREGTLH